MNSGSCGQMTLLRKFPIRKQQLEKKKNKKKKTKFIRQNLSVLLHVFCQTVLLMDSFAAYAYTYSRGICH